MNKLGGALFLAFGLVLLAGFASAHNHTSGCNNPLFSSNEGIRDAILSEPVAANSDVRDFCPNISDGDSTCCSEQAANTFRSAFNQFRNGLRNQVEALSNNRNELLQQVNQMESQRDQMWQVLSQMNPNLDRDTFNQNFNAFVSGMRNWVNTFGNNFGNCARGLLTYTAGMFCLSCSANWQQYVTTSGDSISVTLNQDTCNQMREHCVPLLEGAFEPIKKLLELMNLPVDNFQGPCGSGSCDQFVCQNMVRGLSYDIPSITLPTTPTTSSVVDGSSQFAEAYSKFRESFHALTETVASRKVVATSNNQVSNQYSSDGYAAYSTGSSTNSAVFDTSSSGLGLPGSAPTQYGVTSAILFVVGTLVALIAL